MGYRKWFNNLLLLNSRQINDIEDGRKRATSFFLFVGMRKTNKFLKIGSGPWNEFLLTLKGSETERIRF